MISKSSILPEKLCLEITESVLIDNFENADKVMRELNQQGFKYYLDDFGTGYSNIAYILNFPFKFIKIDRSVLYKSVSDRNGFIIMEGLCKTFSEIGMKVVIEGVENLEQRKLVERIHADYIQGFLFAFPAPADETMINLRKQNSELSNP